MLRTFITPITITLLVCSHPLPAYGTTPEESGQEPLLYLLEEQTAIATRTRMNADYVPGMVTVLHGNDLEARGARTVWEALSLVPGMELALEKTGRRKMLVRGLGNTWASGNIKILLNDVSMNSAELGLADPVLNIPVEQVDRIEVIRGPGSALYGEYAYLGVVNVVTKAEEREFYAFGGSFDTRGVGGVLPFADYGMKASLNLAGWRSSGGDARVSADLLHAYGSGAFSNAPGRGNEEIDAGTAVFKLTHEGFSLTGQWSQDGLGDHFGINYSIPPDPDRIVERSRHRTLDIRQELPLSPTFTAVLQLGWKDVERLRDNLFVNPALDPQGPDRYLDSRHLETNLSLGTDLTYRGWDRHSILVAASSGEVRVDQSRVAFRPDSSGVAIVIPAGTRRRIAALTLQDEYRQSDLFTLTAGVRYDGYSDAGVNYSPRLAGVWRLDGHHIFKAQYAEAFRPPTLYEVATDDYWAEEAIRPATIRTSELGYIYKGPRLESRFTGFYAQLENLVIFSANQAPGVSFGTKGATAWGFELEQGWRLSPLWTLDGNLSYVETRDGESRAPFPGAARWIANGGLLYEHSSFTGALQGRWVSGYVREARDPRPPLAGYATLDLTAGFSHLFARGVEWKVGIKNLLDTDVRYPSPIVDDDAIRLTYPENYPRAGRIWWSQIGYRY